MGKGVLPRGRKLRRTSRQAEVKDEPLQGASQIAALHQRLFDLLQESTRICLLSSERTLKFTSSLEGYAQRLKRPPASKALQVIAAQMLEETRDMCAFNLSLGSQIDEYAEEAYALLRKFHDL